MSTKSLKFLWVLLTILVVTQSRSQVLTNVIYGNIGNYGLSPQTNVTVTLTLISPNPRTVNNIAVMQDPQPTVTDTSGNFSFTNIQWGKYTYSLSGAGTTFSLQIFTNDNGSIPIASRTTTASFTYPNLNTNSYSIAQVNAMILNSTLGSVVAGTNVVIYTNSQNQIVINSTGTTYTFTPTNLPVGSKWVTNGWVVFYPTNTTQLLTTNGDGSALTFGGNTYSSLGFGNALNLSENELVLHPGDGNSVVLGNNTFKSVNHFVDATPYFYGNVNGDNLNLTPVIDNGTWQYCTVSGGSQQFGTFVLSPPSGSVIEGQVFHFCVQWATPPNYLLNFSGVQIPDTCQMNFPLALQGADGSPWRQWIITLRFSANMWVLENVIGSAQEGTD